MNSISTKCMLEMSTTQKPYYGIREELSYKSNKNLDPSTILIFRIDAIERVSFEQVVVGYAFFPLFLDRATDSPGKIDGGEYALHNGFHQLPIYCQNPKLATPVSFDMLTKMERIP